MKVVVDDLHLDELPDEELNDLVALVNEWNREAQPRSVDLSVDEYVIMVTSPGWVRNRFAARSADGLLVGVAEGRHSDDGTNPDLVWAQIRVKPEARRSGVGSLLLGQLARSTAELDRTWIKGWVFDTVPAGAAFAEAVGASAKLEHHENVLAIQDIDWNLMTEWVAQGTARAPGYQIMTHEDGWPAELNDGMANLYYILERDMPMADGFEPREWTAEKVEQMLAHYAETTDSVTAIALDPASGAPVGMSQLMRRHADPATWIVTTTMVDPDHRGLSLGKWLKGAVNLAARDRWDEGVYQETGNAFTNDAMLAINREMGFKHEFTTTDVEMTVTQAFSYLESRGI